MLWLFFFIVLWCHYHTIVSHHKNEGTTLNSPCAVTLIIHCKLTLYSYATASSTSDTYSGAVAGAVVLISSFVWLPLTPFFLYLGIGSGYPNLYIHMFNEHVLGFRVRVMIGVGVLKAKVRFVFWSTLQGLVLRRL